MPGGDGEPMHHGVCDCLCDTTLLRLMGVFVTINALRKKLIQNHLNELSDLENTSGWGTLEGSFPIRLWNDC